MNGGGAFRRREPRGDLQPMVEAGPRVLFGGGRHRAGSMVAGGLLGDGRSGKRGATNRETRALIIYGF